MSTNAVAIARIGRAANPAERGLQLALEDPDVLDAMAENLFLEDSGPYTVETLERWRALTDAERERWRVKALALVREHARQWRGPTRSDVCGK